MSHLIIQDYWYCRHTKKLLNNGTEAIRIGLRICLTISVRTFLHESKKIVTQLRSYEILNTLLFPTNLHQDIGIGQIFVSIKNRSQVTNAVEFGYPP